MVKPSTTMQPEAVNLDKAGRSAGKSFQDDSFNHYMARKIDLQRKQFGLVIPPPPPPPAINSDPPPPLSIPPKPNTRVVRFASDTTFDNSRKARIKRRRNRSGISQVLKRLKRRHGASIGGYEDVIVEMMECTDNDTDQVSTASEPTAINDTALESEQFEIVAGNVGVLKMSPTITKGHRPDLFFSGVVVLVNGYTNPDVQTLQRLLQRHGGDLEKYETTRVTHIIAEHLSSAKANIYKRQKRPIPVCYPSWIVDSVHARKQLPCGEYIIQEVRSVALAPSVATFFHKKNSATMDHGQIVEQQDTCTATSRSLSSKDAAPYDRSLAVNSVPSAHQLDCDHDCDTDAPHKNEWGYKPSDIASVLLVDKRTIIIQEPIMNGSIGSLVNCAVTSTPVENENAGLKTSSCADDLQFNFTPDQPAARSFRPLVDENDGEDSLDRSIKYDNASVSSSVLGIEMESCRNHERSSDGSPHRDLVPRGTDSKYINGKIRTVGTDPNFLETFFAASRLSFIGSFQQRTQQRSFRMLSEKRNYQRYVFHIDIDCFFAAVALRNFPEYQDKPVVISHHGNSGTTVKSTKDSTSECATCNYHARKFGITKGMYLGRAKQLCPDLIVLNYDFDGYKEVSDQLANILSGFADEYGGLVESVSCDESYLEIRMERDKECNHREKAYAIAESIRNEIYETTRCTATVGVASNKFLAKLATDRIKPNKSYVVDDHHELLHELKLSDLHGIGYRLAKKLASEGLSYVRDIGVLGTEGEKELCRILGPGLGKKIYAFCQGIDDRPVEPAERKTIGAECNYGVRFDGIYGVDYMIHGLAKEVQKRMAHVGVTGRKITLKVKVRKPGAPPPPKFLGHGSCFNLSKSSDLPSGATTCNDSIISDRCMIMFSEMSVKTEDVRGMGIVIGKLSRVCTQFPTDQLANCHIASFLRKGKSISSEMDSTPDLDYVDGTRADSANTSAPCTSRRVENAERTIVSEGVVRVHNKGLPVKRTDKGTSLRSAESGSSTNILSVDETAAGESTLDDFDYDIPSASQLHMSQVEALPKSMQEKILAKIRNRQADEPASGHPKQKDMALRQIDIRRNMRLVAMKSINLPELDNLPLRIQLQVANGDDCSIGYLSKKSKKHNRSGKRLGIAAVPKAESLSVQSTLGGSDSEALYVSPPAFRHETVDSDFFRDNIKPLSVFMDRNDPTDDGAVMEVTKYLLLCLNEGRCSDVMVLLRSISHRNDDWRADAFERIMDAVDTTIFNMFGGRLDRTWIQC